MHDLMQKIHRTAIVDPRAQLAEDVRVGPYAVIECEVTIGAGCVIHPHTVIHGHTVIGAGCSIGPAAYVGLDPQHLRYNGETTWLVIGDNTIIREMASVHRSTKTGIENATRVGSRCMLMGGAHVGHDCQLGDDVILANAALLGGHCEVGSRAFLGGGATIHQFCRIGRLAIVAGNEAVSRDVPPFSACRYGGLKGYNAIGCKRAGMPRDTLHAIRAAYLVLHHTRVMSAAMHIIEENYGDVPEVAEILTFAARAHRGLQPSIRFLNGAAMVED